MDRQLTLFDEPQPGEYQYNVFLAIFPDPYTARYIADLGNTLRRKHGIRGSVRPVSHLHVSLHSNDRIQNAPKIPEKAVDNVCKSVTAAVQPFEIKFDRVMSFQRKPGNRPLVLVNDEHENNGVTKLHKSLCAEFAKIDASSRANRKLFPHVTLLYDNHEVAPQPVEPVHWMVKEIVLVRSEVGATRYERLGSWTLGE
jgi:2'-5' RNA ligase